MSKIIISRQNVKTVQRIQEQQELRDLIQMLLDKASKDSPALEEWWIECWCPC